MKNNILTGYKALLIASLKAMLKSPSAVIFSFAFPLVFILAFNYLDATKHKTYKLGIQEATSEEINKFITHIDSHKHLAYYDITTLDSGTIMHRFKHQLLDAIVVPIQNNSHITYQIQSTSLDISETEIVNALLEHATLSEITKPQKEVTIIKAFKKIDYILPGQLGFALLASSVFGTAFLFYNLKSNLVLKRFLATPIHPLSIILAECSARLVIQILSAIFIILVGYFFLDYTLIHGIFTFLQILAICIIAGFTFLGYGFIISSIAKSESIIPPLANIITLPQFILADTFIPLDQFPTWLQYIAKIMPLTYFNNAIRSISFDGMNLWNVSNNIFILIIWGIITIYAATKLFKWK